MRVGFSAFPFVVVAFYGGCSDGLRDCLCDGGGGLVPIGGFPRQVFFRCCVVSGVRLWRIVRGVLGHDLIGGFLRLVVLL